MATLGDMVDRIVDELNRPDLEAAVRSAIASAIQHYRGRRWWFNTSSVDGDPTVAGDDYVDYPAGLIALDQPRGGACGSLFVDTGSGVFDPLVKETAAVLESWGPAGNGTPYAYAEIGGQVQLYPPPAGFLCAAVAGDCRPRRAGRRYRRERLDDRGRGDHSPAR